METRDVLLERLVLDNGYQAHFYDRSRPMAGDRWLVLLLLDIPIPLRPYDIEIPSNLKEAYDHFVSQMGPDLHYQFEKSRHFVPETEKDQILSQLRSELMETTFRYVQHRDFGRNYVLKKFQEWQDAQRCFQAHSNAIKQADARDR